jgi:hypothetical protein
MSETIVSDLESPIAGRVPLASPLSGLARLLLALADRRRAAEGEADNRAQK